MTEATLIDQLARAIAHRAGWFDETSARPQFAKLLNNPLCLEHWRMPSGEPYPEACGRVRFPSPQLGWRAGRAQCRINVIKRELTWREFFAGKPDVYKGFCPRHEDAAQYMRDVLAHLGLDVDVNTPIIALVKHGTPGRFAA